MVRTLPQSRATLTSPNKNRGGRVLVVLGWLLLSGVTALSVAHSMRIYLALTSEDLDGDVDGGERGASSVRQREKRRRPRSTSTRSDGTPADTKDEKEGEDDGPFAMLYPKGDCVGKPIKIPFSSTEKKCRNCRDFCSLKFADREETANLVKWMSMFVFGEGTAEVIPVCLGQFNYDTFNVLNVIKAGDGCVNLGSGASHVRFIEK